MEMSTCETCDFWEEFGERIRADSRFYKCGGCFFEPIPVITNKDHGCGRYEFHGTKPERGGE